MTIAALLFLLHTFVVIAVPQHLKRRQRLERGLFLYLQTPGDRWTLLGGVTNLQLHLRDAAGTARRASEAMDSFSRAMGAYRARLSRGAMVAELEGVWEPHVLPGLDDLDG